MRVAFCGVRGSTPSPGAEFLAYGGHTSCLAVGAADAPPTLILDAGTGIRRVSHLLDGAPFCGAILLTHLHWDHTQGLPFFAAGDRPDAAVDLFLPAQGDAAAAVLGRAMGPPHFPIGPEGLRGRWRFRGLEEGVHRIAGFEVTAREIPHKGGRTFGYRVSDGRSSLAYLPDHGPVALGPGPAGHGPYHEAALALADGADVLVHDAQHTAEELPRLAGFGHSTVDYAVGLADEAGARRLVLFHHAPSRTDDDLDRMAAGIPPPPRVVMAREPMELVLPAGPTPPGLPPSPPFALRRR